MSSTVHAQETHRVSQWANDKVAVWTTIVYPASNQKLAMHRHDHDRVVVALTDGLFKITTDKGLTRYWRLAKNKAYYLQRDPVNELHNDENISKKPVEVLVIELKN